MDQAPVLAITGMTYHDLIGTHYLFDAVRRQRTRTIRVPPGPRL
jgi:hypothetical protein